MCFAWWYGRLVDAEPALRLRVVAGADAARAARRMVGWIVAPELHPLLAGGPVGWVAEGLGSLGLDVRVALFDDGGDRARFVGWRPR